MNDQRPDFDTVWREIERHVRFAVARHRSRDLALTADDLVQEVRIRVWEVWRRDRKSHFRASYYYKVVNSAIVDCLRRHRGTLAHSVRETAEDGADIIDALDAERPGPDERLDDDLRRARLNAALGRLSPARARAVALYLQGFTVPEIAELMQCNPERAHNLAYRGIRALKQLMNKDHE